MLGPIWLDDGLQVTSMYHWFEPRDRRLDLVRPAGDAVVMSVMLLLFMVYYYPFYYYALIISLPNTA